MEIPFTEVRPFLNPLSVHKIPGIGQATYRKLSEMGVRKIETLAEIPQELMFKILGDHGLSLWQKAHGVDLSPVVPYRERKSIGTQTTFENDSMDINKMKAILTGMVTNLTFELRSQQKLTACITVTIRYSNFETVSQQVRIPYTALDSFLIAKAHDLFKKLYSKRMLLRLIGVKLSHLVSGFEQIGLYHTSEEEYDLYQAMDKVRQNYGVESVVKACIVNKPLKDDNGKVIKYNPRKKRGDENNKEEGRKKSRIRTFINSDSSSVNKPIDS